MAAAREAANRGACKTQCTPLASRAKRHRDENKELKQELTSLRKEMKTKNAKKESAHTGPTRDNKRQVKHVKKESVQDGRARAIT